VNPGHREKHSVNVKCSMVNVKNAKCRLDTEFRHSTFF
jgi:hypothetical protein